VLSQLGQRSSILARETLISPRKGREIANLLRDSTSATAWAPSSGQKTPLQLKSGSVPLNNGFGTDEDEILPPIGPDLPSGDPEQFVEKGRVRPWMPTLKDCQLLSHGEIF
jgi:hypothetical protein